MPRKEMTPEERKAWGEKMRAAREKKAETPLTPRPEPKEEPEIAPDQDVNDLKRQVLEMKEMMDLMRQAMVNQNKAQQNPNDPQLNREGRLLGEFTKYTVDPSAYPDPTPRLSDEPRLQPLAFKHNYEITYEVGISSYETKTGQNIREPKFNVTLLRLVLDDQGNRVKVTDPKTGKEMDKFYIVRKLVFHEDPQAAMAIARENGIEVGEQDERLFLNEMRYMRVRDWLFDIFWPRPTQDEAKIQDEVIGGQVVQVFTRNSEESGSIPFDKMTTKFRA